MTKNGHLAPALSGQCVRFFQITGIPFIPGSWKHTGVVNAYKAGVDIKSIQRQCRHTAIDMTDNYLKSLGLYDNEEFLLKMPGI